VDARAVHLEWHDRWAWMMVGSVFALAVAIAALLVVIQ